MAEPKVLSERVEYENDWIKVIASKIQFDDNKTTDWTYLELNNAVILVAVDADKNVYLAKEWRLPFQKYLTELPIGGCTAKSEEGIMKQAHEELMEEIGFDCKKLVRLCPPLVSGRMRLMQHIFLATELFPSKRKGDDYEYIEVVKMPLDEAIKFFTAREETTSATLAGLFLAREKLK